MDDRLNKALVFGSQIFAVLLVVIGATLQRAELKSARPPTATQGGAQGLGTGDRYSRLWEDPLQGLETYEPQGGRSDGKSELTNNAMLIPPVPRQEFPISEVPTISNLIRYVSQNVIYALREVLRDGLGARTPLSQPEKSIVLWNVIDANPTPEAKEVRLRARYAVTSGLAALGYEPDSDSILRKVEVPTDNWALRARNGEKKSLVAYRESFKLRGQVVQDESGSRTVYNEKFPRQVDVFWHPQQMQIRENSESKTYSRCDTPQEVSRMLKATPDDTDNKSGLQYGSIGEGELAKKVHVIHYGNSSQLREFQSSTTSKESMDNVHFVRATIPSSFVKGEYGLPSRSVMTDDRLVAALSCEIQNRIPALAVGEMNYSLKLSKVGAVEDLEDQEDSCVIIALVDGKLHIRVFDSSGRQFNKAESEMLGGAASSPLVLYLIQDYKNLLNTKELPRVSEWPKSKKRQWINNAYICMGRASPRILIVTESDGEYGDNLKELLSDEFGSSASIEVQGYLRGLDGLASEFSVAARNGSTPKGESTYDINSAGGYSERSWGTSQYDYLRRMAAEIRRKSDRGQLVAIGVLGTDIYDKLLVLQALHSEIPDILYFTTDLDSLYLSRDHLPFTRNLVVASGEALDLSNRGNFEHGDHGISPYLRQNFVSIPSMRDCYQTALIHTIYNIVNGGATTVPHDRPATLWEVGSGVFVALGEGGAAPVSNPEGRSLDRFLMLSLSHRMANTPIFLFGLVHAVFMLLSILALKRKKRDQQLSAPRTCRMAAWIRMVASYMTRQLYQFGWKRTGGCLRVGLLFFASRFRLSCLYMAKLLHGAGFLHTAGRLRTAGWLMAFLVVTPVVAYVIHSFFGQRIFSSYLCATGISILLVFGWPIHLLIGGISGRTKSDPPPCSPEPFDWRRCRSWLSFWAELSFVCLFAISLAYAILKSLFPEGSMNMWAGEFLSPVVGAAIWPTILLRVLAFAVGLALLYKTIHRFVKRRETFQEALDYVSIFHVDRGGQATREVRQQRNRVIKRVRDTLVPSKIFWPAIFWSAIYFGISAILFRVWPSYVPGRGGICLAVEKISLSMGVGLYIIHLWFCVVLHFNSFRTIALISKELKRNQNAALGHFKSLLESDRTRSLGNGDPVSYFTALEYQKMLFDGCDKLSQGVQGLTKFVGLTLLYPLTILSILLISRLRIFDDWNMMPSLLITFLFGAFILLFSSVLLLSISRALRRHLTGFLQEIAELYSCEFAESEIAVIADPKQKAVQVAKAKLQDLKHSIDRLSTAQEGAFAPWYGQPIFIALLSAVAVIGSTNLVGPLTSILIR